MFIAPVFELDPRVNVCPPVFVVIASLTLMTKFEVLPITCKLPLAKAFSITEALMFAVPVTVSVFPVILQFVPDVPVWPEVEIVKFWAFELPKIKIVNNKISFDFIDFEFKNFINELICLCRAKFFINNKYSNRTSHSFYKLRKVHNV